MENIRKFSKSWKGKVVMASFLAPMAFLGMSQPSGGVQGDVVAVVGKTELSQSQLDNQINSQRNALLRSGMDSKDVNEEELKKASLEYLINQSLLTQQAYKLGIVISDRSITQLLKSYPAFLDIDGKFSNEKFAQVLRLNRLTKEQLFSDERARLSVSQVQEGIIDTAIYPMSEIDKIIDLEFETRNVWLYRLPWQDFKDEVVVAEDDIKKYFDENAAKLVSTPKVDLSVLALNNDTVSISAEEITDTDLQEQYKAFILENNYLDMREFSQILLTGDNAESKARQVKAKLDAGADFKDMAKEFSDDESASSGGVIGKLDTSIYGQDAKKVDEQIKDLKLNEISEPIKSSFGYQIFTVSTDNSDQVPSLDSMKDELTAKAITYKKSVLIADKTTQINALAADGFAISDIAKEVGITVEKIKDYQQSDNNSKFSQPEVLKAAFNEINIADMTVSTGLNIEDSVVWVQSENFRPKKQLNFEQAKNKITDILIQKSASELAVKQLQSKSETVKTKSDIESLGIEFTELKNINRNSPELKDSEKSVAFSKNDQSLELMSIVVRTDTGASLIIADSIVSELSKVLPEIQKQKFAEQIRSNFGQGNLKDYLDHLKVTYDVKVNDDVKK